MRPYTATLLKLSAALILCASVIGASAQQQDQDAGTQAIVRRALIENRRDLSALRDYIFVESRVTNYFDNQNRVKNSDSRQEEVFFIDGFPYERLIQVDGQPLSEAMRSKQEERIDREIRESQLGSAKQKEFQRKAAKELQEDIAIREDVVDGFIFTKIGEEQRDGDSCVELSVEPRDDFKGKSPLRSILPLLHGTIWIDVQNGQWVQIDAAPIQKLGRGPAYVNETSAMHLRQGRIDADLWGITSSDIRLDARLLWDRKNLQVVKTFTNFRKFSTTVHILTPADAPTDSTQNPPPPK
ncbi:MAG: hypothetical protein WB795_21540 [Candidatus Acidiferrales bacterium]